MIWGGNVINSERNSHQIQKFNPNFKFNPASNIGVARVVLRLTFFSFTHTIASLS